MREALQASKALPCRARSVASLLLSEIGATYCMANIRTSCRERLTAIDLNFVAAAVSSTPLKLALASPPAAGPATAVAELLREPGALDAALDDERVERAILDFAGQLPVSPALYFYVLTRRMLRRFDREVADYVAGVLSAFVEAPIEAVLPYVTDLLTALRGASSEEEYAIRVRVGERSLFVSGLFPEHIAHRAQRAAAPPLAFYEEVGSENYRRASDHRLAREQSLAETFRTMAERFSEVRHGLNQMADRWLCLEAMP
jgi:hypothetical protein